jgi:branched-chain amino acid aminotransferase
MALRGAVYVNGRISPAADAVVPVFDHGFMYGEGVYEVVRTYNGVPFLFAPHMRRLRQSARLINLDVPFSDADLTRFIDDTRAAAGEMREAYIRILLTRGIGETSYDLKTTPAPSLIIIVKPVDDPPARVTEHGINIALVSIIRNHPGSVNPIIKSNNLLNNALAMQEAHRLGGEEGLMCNYRGEISECAQSNFFLVRDGVVLTPPSEAGLLEGITREYLFEVGKDIGIDVRAQVLYPADLKTADEAFITSTTREISPVVSIGGTPVGSGQVGPITRRMLESYRRRAQELTRAGAAVSR